MRHEEKELLLDSVGDAFSQLRQRTGAALAGQGADKKDRARYLVVTIVDQAEGEITVGGIAGALSVDPSAASRLVADCIGAGYLERAASQEDGRRTVLRSTREGAALRERFGHLQREAFERITAAWPESERLEFARLLVRYAQDSNRA